MEALFLIWNEGIIRPMLNLMVLLYATLWHQFGVSILVFTVIVRLATMPLTLRQMRQTKLMAQMQPKIQELRRRYANDRQRQSQEQMRLFRENRVSPVGCLGPMLIQFPIWIGLYQAIIRALPTTPESLVGLSEKLYVWLPAVHRVVPLNSEFLWLDLALPDPLPVLPVLVGASMWVLQKMMTMPSTDPNQQRTNQMMLWMMPLFMGFICLQFPSGLALYIFASNMIGMAIQYPVTGWGTLRGGSQTQLSTAASKPEEEIENDGEQGQSGIHGQERRGSHRASAGRARRRGRRGQH